MRGGVEGAVGCCADTIAEGRGGYQSDRTRGCFCNGEARDTRRGSAGSGRWENVFLWTVGSHISVDPMIFQS